MARWSRTSRVLVAVVTLLLVAACGEDREPRPGAADPCMTAAAGVLGCPAGAQASVAPAALPTVEQACRKLADCGVLAGEFLGQRSSTSCSGDGDCGTGECLRDSKGEARCHYHYLDYAWCVSRMTAGRRDDPCGTGRFQQAEVDLALACIARTDCTAIGAPFDQKRQSSSSRPALDKYTCNDGQTKFTATVCDSGLLAY